MASTQAVPRPPRSGSPTPNRMPLTLISSKGNGLANRYILHAVEGWGKTSFAAQTPRPIFLMIRDTGLETLIENSQLPEIPHFPAIEAWEDLLGALETLRTEPHDFRTVVLDVLNGAERLCHEHVCTRDFNGDWSDKGFEGYKRGYEISLADWRGMLAALDRLRVERKMAVMALCHTKVETFKNPTGPDYDRFQGALYKSTVALTNQWADAVLFGNFEVSVGNVQENKKTGATRGKGMGGKTRVMYCSQDASMVAKNRLGLPDEIEMGDSPQQAWTNFVAALKESRKDQVSQ